MQEGVFINTVESWLSKCPSYGEVMKVVGREGDFIEFPLSSFSKRSTYTDNFSFALPCKEAMNLIKKYSPILEIGAGSGFWAKMMHNAGIDIVATSINKGAYALNKQNYFPVKRMEASRAVKIHPDRNVFVSWVNYGDNWGTIASKNIKKGRHLIVIGEGEGGCTSNDKFFELIYSRHFEEIERLDIPKWYGLHDDLRVYRKMTSE